jgi:hypothetical protein
MNSNQTNATTTNTTNSGTQLLEILAKLDLILVNQLRLENILASQGIVGSSGSTAAQALGKQINA